MDTPRSLMKRIRISAAHPIPADAPCAPVPAPVVPTPRAPAPVPGPYWDQVSALRVSKC